MKSIPLLALLGLSIASAPQSQAITYTTAKSMVKDCALAYAITMATTAAHELGHALSNKLFYGKASAINIGGGHLNPAIAQLPGLTIRSPLLPFVGFTTAPEEAYLCSETRRHKNKIIHLKNISSFLAGPAAGSISAYAFLRKLNQAYPDKTKYAFSKLISKSIMLGQLAINLIPSSFVPFVKARNKGDGDYILEAICASKECSFLRQKKSLLYRWFGI